MYDLINDDDDDSPITYFQGNWYISNGEDDIPLSTDDPDIEDYDNSH